MPPIGLPKRLEPRSSSPQYLALLLLAAFLVMFTVTATVLIMRAIEQKPELNDYGEQVEQEAPPPAPENIVGSPAFDREGFVKAFEAKLGRMIKKIDNNVFTVGKNQIALDVRNEGTVELRTYVSWNRLEGMAPDEAWVAIDLLDLTEGEEPSVTHVESLLGASELSLVNGVSVMFDPISDEEILATLDSQSYWASKHPGGAWK